MKIRSVVLCVKLLTDRQGDRQTDRQTDKRRVNHNLVGGSQI